MVRPAHCTALGKVILAALRPDQLQRFVERVELKPSTEKSITEVPVLLREIEEVRRSGIAFDDGEFNPEVRCVAVPVRDFTGNVVGALGISGPVWRLTIQALQSRSKIVQAAADRLSTEFGAKREPTRTRRRPAPSVSSEGARGHPRDCTNARTHHTGCRLVRRRPSPAT